MNADKSKSRRNIYIVVVCVVCALGLGGVWVLLGRSPRTYRPITAANPHEVSPYLTHKLGPDFYNQVQWNEPFELVIEQDGLNDILARQTWPQQFGDVAVAKPAVRFGKDVLYLMGQIEYRGFSSVLTIVARPVRDETGQVNLNIRSVWLGWVPVTKIAARVAEKAVADSGAAFRDWPEIEAMVQAIVNNSNFLATFDFGRQRIFLDDFELEAGLLRLRLRPENKAVYRY